jgi:hypothetical protein
MAANSTKENVMAELGIKWRSKCVVEAAKREAEMIRTSLEFRLNGNRVPVGSFTVHDGFRFSVPPDMKAERYMFEVFLGPRFTGERIYANFLSRGGDETFSSEKLVTLIDYQKHPFILANEIIEAAAREHQIGNGMLM